MIHENEEALKKLTDQFELTVDQYLKLSQYVDLFEAWAHRTNLVSKNDRKKFVSRHIFESLEITRHSIIYTPCTLLDFGTGSGLPGIPLAIYYSDVQLTLVDSKRLKTLFLQDVVENIGLQNVKVLCTRVENLSPSDFYDVVTARAVARLKKLWSLSHPLLKPGGRLIALKGGDLEEEVEEVQKGYRVSIQIQPFVIESHQNNSGKKIVIISR